MLLYKLAGIVAHPSSSCLSESDIANSIPARSQYCMIIGLALRC